MYIIYNIHIYIIYIHMIHIPYIYERETSVCMCYDNDKKQRKHKICLTNFRVNGEIHRKYLQVKK